MSGGRSSGELAAPRVDARPSGRAVYVGNQTVKSSQCAREVQLPGSEAFFDLLKKHGRQPTKEA